MINMIETESETPICPYCENNIIEVFAKKIKSNFGVRFIYFCKRCKKVLGISHRKGFWMG
jgi:uncharacterized protein with PIN domain